jgi:hypothetical protein
MQKLSLKTVYKYLYDQLTGNFLGFLIGASATGLVSQFFETRGLKNLWGLTAKKTVVDKGTFQNLEWIISIVIGFIVFEIMTKVVKAKLEKHLPTYKRMLFRWIIKVNLHEKIRSMQLSLNEKRTVFFVAVHQGVKQGLSRFSNRQ